MAPPRRRLLGTSTKMYFDLPTTASYAESLAALGPLAAKAQIDLFLIPSFLSIPSTASILAPSGIRLGGQNCLQHISGPYTGEVSPLQLKQAGVSLVELGHAERRRL